MKRKILPGIILALALGSVGVWALVTNTGSFPKFNRYYHLDDYLDDLEAALSRSIPFSDNLSSLAIDLKMKGGAREFDNIFRKKCCQNRRGSGKCTTSTQFDSLKLLKS